jgi:hypothetical protein
MITTTTEDAHGAVLAALSDLLSDVEGVFSPAAACLWSAKASVITAQLVALTVSPLSRTSTTA